MNATQTEAPSFEEVVAKAWERSLADDPRARDMVDLAAAIAANNQAKAQIGSSYQWRLL